MAPAMALGNFRMGLIAGMQKPVPSTTERRHMTTTAQVAHMNVARLRFPPGDPRVAGFIDNVARVNAVAERSPGYVWRLSDESAAVGNGITFQAVDPDPCLAISLSVWDSVESLWHFVNKTVHGGFLKRRVEWFAPWTGPNYVIWPHAGSTPPTLAEGWTRLRRLADHGAMPEAYDFKYAKVVPET